MEEFPSNPEEVVDLVAKSGYLKVENEELSISLDTHNQINIQPKGTPLGAKLRVEDSGNITPIITFDTKKLREPRKEINPVEMLDKALEDYLNGQEI
jgi:hypothetical protein